MSLILVPKSNRLKKALQRVAYGRSICPKYFEVSISQLFTLFPEE